MILDALLHVNDVVGINDFELVIQQFELDALVSFLDDIHTQCLDYNRRVCFIIDASNIKQANTIKLFITKFVELQLPNISLVFDVTSRELMELHDLFCEIVKLYAQKNWKFNIKNDDVHRAPYIIGRAGPYTISPSDWAAYLSDEPTIGMSLTQATVVIDLAKYTNKAKEFEHMMQAVAKSLFIVDKTQHKDAEEYFRHLIKHRGFVSERFFTASTLSVRFLNTSHVAVDTALALLTQSKEFLSAFSSKQECIFGSCGMPIRCSIVQGLAYKHAVATFFTENERLDIAIGTDLYKPEFRKALNMHEEFAKILSGGYEVRINRTAIASPPDVLGECSLLMNTYVIPFFCYRFDIPSRQTKQLSTYLEQK
jgi:hypothetical protein